jgi:CRISPR/Cas system-associated endoribonuclease Cas2
MELDINTDWVQYSTFSGALNTPVNGSNGKSLLASMAEGPSRYFATWENRDFFTMTLRKNETIVTAKSTKKK